MSSRATLVDRASASTPAHTKQRQTSSARQSDLDVDEEYSPFSLPRPQFSFSRIAIFPPPTIPVGSPHDPLEHEADHIANRVVAQPTSGAHPRISNALSPQTLARSPLASSANTSAPPIVHHALSQSSKPLDSATRRFMEPHLGRDFSDVRIHTDVTAAQSAEAIDAAAYTHGKDIYFGAVKFQPGTTEGRKLLAHELTHTLQQREAPPEQNVIRRSPKSLPVTSLSYSCTRVDLVGKILTFHGNHGNVSVTWDISQIVTPGSYKAFAEGSTFRTDAYLGGAEIHFEDADKDLFNHYVESLETHPVTLVVHGTGSKKAGSKAQPGSDTGSAGDPVPTPDDGGDSTDGGDQLDQKAGSGSNAGSPQTGEKEQPDGKQQGSQGGGAASQDSPYPDKLQAISDLPEAKRLTPDQAARLKTILDQLSDSDISKFKQYAHQNPGGDPESLITSLRTWLTINKQLADKPSPSSPDGTNQPDDSQQQEAQQDDPILDKAVQNFDPKDSAKNEANARETIEQVSNKQLKNLSAKDIAEGIVRVDKQLKSAGTDISDGLSDALSGDNVAEGAAGGARAIKGAATLWAIFSVAAMFVPGLNVAVLAANAMVAGLAAYAALTAQKEFEIQAAAQASTPQNYEKHLRQGIEARNQFVIQTVVLALPLVGKLFQQLPVPAGLRNVASRLRSSANALKTGGAKAFQSAKSSSLEAVQQFRQNLLPYGVQVRTTVGAIIKRLRSSSDFIGEVQKIPELNDLVPASEIKALKALPPDQLKVAEEGILSDLDNSPALAENLLKSLDKQAASIETSVQSATDARQLEATLDQSANLADPKAAGIVAEKEAVINTVKEKAAKLNYSPSEVSDTLTDLRDAVNNLPDTNPNKVDALRELNKLRGEVERLKTRPGAGVSERLEAINQRAEEIDDQLADAISKSVGGTKTPAKAPAAKAPVSVPGQPVNAVLRHTTDEGRVPASVSGPLLPAEEKLVSLAGDAMSNSPQGANAANIGSFVHKAFADSIRALKDPNIHAEISYRNGIEVPYGAPDSVRFDAIIGPRNAPTAAYDLKTGDSGITAADITKMRNNLPPASRNIPIREIGR
jgi:hypothetical protein